MAVKGNVVKAKKLTYENIKQFMENYFNELYEIEGLQDVPKISEYFTEDCKIVQRSHLDRYKTFTRDEWLKSMCGHADRFKILVKMDEPALGLIIDEKRGMGVTLEKEYFMDPKTGQSHSHEWQKANGHPILTKTGALEQYRIVIWSFRIVDNKVKAYNEIVIRPFVEPL